MPRLNLEEQILSLTLCNIMNPNAAEVARRMSEQLGRKIYPKSIITVWKRSDIGVYQWGKPPRVSDEKLIEYFQKHQCLGVLSAAKKTAEELGYKTYLIIKYRWREMGLI